MPSTQLSSVRTLALLAIALLSPVLLAASRAVLPAEAEVGFKELIRKVNDEHRLGTDVRITAVSIAQDQARLTLATTVGTAEVVLRHPTALPLGEQTHWFATTRPDTLERRQWRELLFLLDETFRRNPWIPARNAQAGPSMPDPLAWVAPTQPRIRVLPLAALVAGLALVLAVVVFRQRRPDATHVRNDSR